MKRLSCGLFALCLSVVAGCQSTPPPASSESPAAPASQEAPSPAATNAPSDASASAEPAAASAPAKRGAPLFANMGSFQRDVTTSNDQVRRYFNQGMVLAYGFNHEEAARSFREAARLDPNCAACWWGVALVLGPNINLPMLDPVVPEAYAASRKAQSLAKSASPVEQALIAALVTRYVEAPVADRSNLDRAYADAMRDVAEQFPKDPDVLSLFAESLLDLSPWNYWLANGKPKDTAAEAIQTLERAMEISPYHPGALHYYIHALEETQPARATPAADRLRDLVPDAGHLVHMPGHIYLRTGRYQDAVAVNIKAGEADTSYINQCQVQGFYALGYHPHNWHFVWAAATFAGNRQNALMGAEKTQHLMHGNSPDDPAFGPIVQHFALTPLFANVRFGMWDEVLSTPAPAGPYPQAIWHYARGLAYAARGDLTTADHELEEVKRLGAHPALPKVVISARNSADKVVAIAERMLAADLASRRKNYSAAVASLRDAARLEDAMGYTEPEDWHYPVRQYLGAVLLDAGKPKEAEAVYRQDLEKHPENGWSLFGLAQALKAQGKKASADDAMQRFETAWRHADVKLTSSVIR
jgi:tetratricopeptide (TPR) repeat protein